MNKKELVFLIFGLIVIIGLVHGVSAETSFVDDFSKIIDEFSGVIRVFFSALLGESNSNALFFERCLLLIIVYGIIYMILGKFDIFSSSPFLLFFISLSVSVLGIRFLTEGFIASILVPYSALGASIAIFLPFIIYFFFVHFSVKGVFARRAAWIIFGVILAGIYLSKVFTLETSSDEFFYNNLILVGIFLAVIAAAFDPQVHAYFGAFKTGKALREQHRRAYDNIMLQINTLIESKQHDPARMKELERQLKYHQSQM